MKKNLCVTLLVTLFLNACAVMHTKNYSGGGVVYKIFNKYGEEIPNNVRDQQINLSVRNWGGDTAGLRIGSVSILDEAISTKVKKEAYDDLPSVLQKITPLLNVIYEVPLKEEAKKSKFKNIYLVGDNKELKFVYAAYSDESVGVTAIIPKRDLNEPDTSIQVSKSVPIQKTQKELECESLQSEYSSALAGDIAIGILGFLFDVIRVGVGVAADSYPVSRSSYSGTVYGSNGSSGTFYATERIYSNRYTQRALEQVENRKSPDSKADAVKSRMLSRGCY